MSARDYADSSRALKRDFPGRVVSAGAIRRPSAGDLGENRRSFARRRRGRQAHHGVRPEYFTTYYAIDAINFTPVDVSSALDTLEGPIAAGRAGGRGPAARSSFAEQKRILQRCGGVFYACAGGAEARHFNRLLIDAGLIKRL